MISSFTYEAPAQRVVFGRGTLAQVGDEIRRLGHGRALVLSTPPQEADAQRLASALGSLAAGVFAGVAADLAVAAPYPNPAPLDRAAIRVLLQAAFDGTAPR